MATVPDQILSQWFSVLTGFPAPGREAYFNQPFLVFSTILPHVAPSSIADNFLCVGEGVREGKKVGKEEDSRHKERDLYYGSRCKLESYLHTGFHF